MKLLPVFTLSLLLALSGVASANPITDTYGGASEALGPLPTVSPVSPEPPAQQADSLPFTGSDLSLVFFGAILFLFLGFLLRRAVK